MSSGGAQLSRRGSAPSGSKAAVACARVSPVNKSPFSSQTKLTQQGRPRLLATSSAARASPMLFTGSSSTRSAPASFITWKISRYSRRGPSARGGRGGPEHPPGRRPPRRPPHRPRRPGARAGFNRQADGGGQQLVGALVQVAGADVAAVGVVAGGGVEGGAGGGE